MKAWPAIAGLALCLLFVAACAQEASAPTPASGETTQAQNVTRPPRKHNHRNEFVRLAPYFSDREDRLQRREEELRRREASLDARERKLSNQDSNSKNRGPPFPTLNLDRLRNALGNLSLSGPEWHSFNNNLRLLSHYGSGLAIHGVRGARWDIGFDAKIDREPVHRRIAFSNCRGVDCFNSPVEELAQVLYDLFFVANPQLTEPKHRRTLLDMMGALNRDRDITLVELEKEVNRLDNLLQISSDQPTNWRYAYGKGVLALRRGTREVAKGMMTRVAHQVAGSQSASSQDKSFYDHIASQL